MAIQPALKPSDVISVHIGGAFGGIDACVSLVYVVSGPPHCEVVYLGEGGYPYSGDVDWDGEKWVFHTQGEEQVDAHPGRYPRFAPYVAILRGPRVIREAHRVPRR